MTSAQIVWCSLKYYWKTHLAVFLGVIAGTAVIGGALVVGDSVRASLRQMSLDRLGEIDQALRSHRFFREELVQELSELPEFQTRFSAAAPVLIMNGGLVRQTSEGVVTDRVSGITVYAIDDRFRQFGWLEEEVLPVDDAVVLSHRVGRELSAKAGDAVTLWLELPTNIPRDTLLGGSEESTTQEVPLKCRSVLPETSGIGRLDLNPGQQLPLTVFVSLKHLQFELGLEKARRSAEFPQGKPARVNGLFLRAKSTEDSVQQQAEDAARSATDMIGKVLKLSDLGLRVVSPEHNGQRYLSVESEQMILEDSIVAASRSAASSLKGTTSPVMAYLINEFSNADDPQAFSMYSIIGGIEPEHLLQDWLQGTALQPQTLADDEIVLNDWLATDLHVKAGDKVRVKYHLVGSHGELPEEVREFRVKAVLDLATASAINDRAMTPEVKGVTDADTYSDWKQPFPMQINRVTKRDDAYWLSHRALPKAFVSLKVAQELWSSRYGKLTSLRVKLPDSTGSSDADFESRLLAQLKPAELGFAVQPVKWQGVRAASGTTDFTGLFFGFSMFVIGAAMVLIGLLFRLGIERRLSQIGLLQAVGFNSAQVRSLILKEGLCVAVLGGTVGAVAAVGYAELMVAALKSPSWWGGALGTQFLFVAITPVSLFAGFAISVSVAWLALSVALRGLREISPRQLLSGSCEINRATATETSGRRKLLTARRVVGGCIGFVVPVLVLGLIGGIPNSEAFSGLSWSVVAFFLVGVALLTGALTQLHVSLSRETGSAVRGGGLWGTLRLGLRNAARNRLRSVFSTAMIASATFVIVAVAAGRRDPGQETPDRRSGNGGFEYVAETATPILPDLNTVAGRAKLLLDQVETNGTSTLSRDELQAALQSLEVCAFRVKPGENASCLNIYQTSMPTILGVPESLIRRGGFKFIDGGKADYWRLLGERREDGRMPVLGDMNTLMFSLHKGPGASIPVTNTTTGAAEFAVVGMLDSSVFQGVLLVSEENFRRLYPEVVGYRYFLLGSREADQPVPHMTQVAQHFETRLTSYAFDAERVVDRIAAFLIVQNTYLSTFQTLGGLGLLLGTFGLGTVMLRNVIERRSELALLGAIGFRRRRIGLMVLAENTCLLLFGLATGTISALLAMLPHLISIGADTPWLSGGQLLLLVFACGMTSAVWAVKEATRGDWMAALRSQ